MLGKLKSLWARYWLRHSKFTGRYDDLRKLYSVKDPWNLSSPTERVRFERSNDLVRTLAPDCGRLLELGCGEGLQTIHLTKVSRSVSGLDVSEKAIARARELAPAADLKVGRAEDIGTLFAGERFDLVTAFEVLYYSSDIDRVIGEMQQLSDRILVTNYAARAERMRGYFTGPDWTRHDDIVADGTVWECRSWRRPDS